MPMSPKDLRSKLQGVVGFPVTPFAADMSLDLEGLRRNLRAMLRKPPCAIVAAGGTGELYSLSPAEHLAVVKVTVEETQGAAPVIAGVGFNPVIAADLARQSAEAGASGLLAFPPYYPNADDDGLFEYYSGIAKACPLGLLVYSRDWFQPSASLIERLTSIESLIAWKDGQGDIRRLQILRDRVGDRLHWVGGAGDDLVPAYYSLGIRTFTSSVANISTAISWQLHDYAAKGDMTRLQPLMDRAIVPLYAFRARRRGYEVTAMKVLMDHLGLAGGPVRPPLAMVKPEDAQFLRDSVPMWKELIAAAEKS
jgi:5-dehydro-4-deoxyglucarate dehydratase